LIQALEKPEMRNFPMKKIRIAWLLAVFAAAISLSSPAWAQSYASVAGSGNACSSTAPCALEDAIKLAPADAMVSCINGGNGHLSFSTSHSLTVDCPGGVLSGSSTGNPAITLSGGSSQVVILRNLTFNGSLGLQNVLIRVTGGATLIIENCKFQNVSPAKGDNTFIAIQYQPNSPAAQLIIRDSVFANDGGTPSSGGGLQVAPAAGGSASVKLERVSFEYNVTGMVLSGAVNATMIGSTVSASRSNGILIGSGATLDIVGSKLAYNVGAAVSVSSGGTLTLSDTDIKHNQIGVSNGGGQALSYRNNRIFGNGSTATLGTIAGGQ
jgi:hypothetical protein